jgi:hypothetical protein
MKITALMIENAAKKLLSNPMQYKELIIAVILSFIVGVWLLKALLPIIIIGLIIVIPCVIFYVAWKNGEFN